MKKLLLLLALTAFGASASERIHAFCRFDAIAAGYTSEFRWVNLILANGNLYNQDGSKGPFQGKGIFACGSGGDTFLYDGRHYRLLGNGAAKLPPELPPEGLLGEWSLNTGTVSCLLERGWTELP